MLTNHLPEAAQPTLRCPGCKHANPAHSNFCNICGRGLPSVPCPQCGEMNDLAMATMCSRCGGPLTDRADSEAAKDARLRVIEAAMGGGFPPMAVPRAADTPASPSSVDVDVNALAELSPPTIVAASEPALDARPAAPPIPVAIPTLTAAITTPLTPLTSSPPSAFSAPLASSPMAAAAPAASAASASAWASRPSPAAAPRASTGPPAPSLARMPRSSEAPVLGAAIAPTSGSAPAQASPSLADFGPSAFNLHQLNAGHSANSAPFVLTGWRTEEPQHADFDMRQITELVRTSLAAETVPMLPALSSGGTMAAGEPEPPPGRVSARPRRLAMAGGVAAALVVAVLVYRVYGPARVPELTPVPLAGGGAAATTATAAVDSKAAQMQANLDRAAELLARRPTGAGGEAGGGAGVGVGAGADIGASGRPADGVGNATPKSTPTPAPTATSRAEVGVAAAALSGTAPSTSTPSRSPAAAESPIAAILPSTLAPAPPSTGTRQDTPRPAHPSPSRETAVAAARAAKSPSTGDSGARPYSPYNRPSSAYRPPPAPTAGPCTEGVAALGLCDAVTSPATPRR